MPGTLVVSGTAFLTWNGRSSLTPMPAMCEKEQCCHRKVTRGSMLWLEFLLGMPTLEPLSMPHANDWMSVCKHHQATLTLHYSLLYCQWQALRGKITFMQLLGPHFLRQDILQLAHGLMGMGHFWEAKTLQRLRSWCQDVEFYVHFGIACTARKGPTQQLHTPLQQVGQGTYGTSGGQHPGALSSLRR